MSQLCQLQDVKTYLGSAGSNSDAVLTMLIGAVSALIESYCNRVFALADYTERRNGNGSSKLYLVNGPVQAVTAVSVDGQPVSAAQGATDGGYVWDDMAVYLRPGANGPQFFARGLQNVAVTYSAGYATTPPEIAQACVEWVAFKFAKRDRIDKRSETLGQSQTITYDASDMPAGVKSALAPYIRWNAR